VHSLLHDLPVNALSKRAALRDRRDWKIAAMLADPSRMRLLRCLLHRWVRLYAVSDEPVVISIDCGPRA